jgi:hypothetical protein
MGTPPPHRSLPHRRVVLRTALLVAAVCLAVVVATGAAPSSGHAAATAACTKHITVVFMFYAGQQGDLSKNSCWEFQRPINDAGTFITCRSSDGRIYGSGSPSQFIFDDTNPQHDLSGSLGENTLLSNHCGVPLSLSNYGELMAPRFDDSHNWCANNSLNQPCWRHNDAGGSFFHYYAELYSDDAHGYDLRDNWTSCVGYGACYLTSRPLINVRIWLGSAPNLTSATNWECSWTSDGQYMAMYSSAQLGAGDTSAIFQAIDSCTTT